MDSDRVDVLRAVRGAIGGDYEILGELGREGDRAVAWLARHNRTSRLVALKLESDSDRADAEISVHVKHELDGTVPAPRSHCPQCGATLHGWSRYCPSCSADLGGEAAPATAAELRDAAERAATGRYRLLGDLPRAEGGQPVFFGREDHTGEIVALRPEQPTGGAGAPLSLTATQVLRPIKPDEPSLAAAPPGPRRVTLIEEPGRPPATPAEGPYVCPSCGTRYPPGTWFCPRDGAALRPVAGSELIGRIIAGRYRVLRRLGEGGMAQVYLAEHIRIGRLCALKIMDPALRNDPEALGRFAREAAHTSRISHPNVAAVYDAGDTDDGLVYLAMEYCEGERLSDLLEREGPLPAKRAVDIARQIADALATAHALGIVHRDLKPDNVIMVRRGDAEHVKVVDFGIAKAVQGNESQRLTRTGFLVGTPRYMSPEQLTGDTVDERSDVYSLGCMLYEMLTGGPPFGETTGAAVITRRLTEPPPRPRAVRSDLSDALDALVVHALARSPADRIQSAAELGRALAQVDTEPRQPPIARLLAEVEPRAQAAGHALRSAWLALLAWIAAAARATVGAATRLGRATAAALREFGGRLGRYGHGVAAVGPVIARWWREAGARIVGLGSGTVRAVGSAAGSARASTVRAVAAVPRRAWVAAGGVVTVGIIAVALVAALPRVRDEPGASAAAELGARSPSTPTPPSSTPGETGTVPPTIAMPVPVRPDSDSVLSGLPGTGVLSPDRRTPARSATDPLTRTPPSDTNANLADSVTALAPSPQAVDSVRALFDSAMSSREAGDYVNALRVFRAAEERIARLRTEFPSAGVVRELGQQHQRMLQATINACSELRQVRLDLGLEPPQCDPESE